MIQLGHRLIQVTGEAKLFIYLQQRQEEGAAVMGTMRVTPPLLTSFLNCSASLATLYTSLLYYHNEVLIP